MPPGKNARADASDGIFSGISLPRPSAFWVQGDTPWSLRVGRESRGPREGESKHPPWPSGPCGAEREEVYGSSAAITHSLLRLANFFCAPFCSPLSLASLASSPGGRAKCTSVNREKLCGKANCFAALPYHLLCRHQRACSWLPPRGSCHAALRHD